MRADDPIGELATVRDWLRYAVSRLRQSGVSFGQGTLDGYDEAAYLILHTLGLPLDRLEPFLDARLLPSERHALFGILGRRIDERMPAAYLTREAWLGQHRFYVDRRVIVPRSHVAELLEHSLAPWVDQPARVARVLDLCTGCGCLAILAALAFPRAEVDAVDLSREAIEVAERNVADYRLGDRVRLLHGDLYDKLAGRRYDLILCNPPYVTEAAMQDLPAEFRREPALALAGGTDGMDVVRRVLADARSHLLAEGLLVMEVGHNRSLADAAFPDLALTWVATPSADDAVFVIRADELPGGRSAAAPRATRSRRKR